jgi:exodeoxyribonuclease V alpha subunit
MNKPNNRDWDHEELCGVIERITYHSQESGYTIARLKLPKATQLMTVVGSFASIQAGQTLQLKGVWGEHPKYGLQFQVAQYQDNTSCLRIKQS